MRTNNAHQHRGGVTPTIAEWKVMMKDRPKLRNLVADLHPDAPGEFSIISGRTGIGKTNLQLHLAFCLATGTPFFGMNCEKVGVNMLAFEGPEQNIYDRVKKVERHYPSPEGRLHFEFLPTQSPGKLFEAVETRLRKTPGCKVAILDAVRYIVNGDYLDPRDARPFIQDLKTLLTEVGMSAFIALPIGKPKNQGQLIDPTEVYNIKGATEWVDAAISVLLLEKRMRKPASHLVLGFAKRRIAEHDAPNSINLLFDYERCLYAPDRIGTSDNGSGTRLEMVVS